MNLEINCLKELIQKFESKTPFSIDTKIINNKNDYNFILERLKKVNYKTGRWMKIKIKNFNIVLNIIYRTIKDDEAKFFIQNMMPIKIL